MFLCWVETYENHLIIYISSILESIIILKILLFINISKYRKFSFVRKMLRSTKFEIIGKRVKVK